MAAQTCDRTITGRNFDYGSALNVIQSEDYLEQEDFDEIYLSHRQGEVIEAIENFKEKISADNKLLGKRQKRQTVNDEEERVAKDFDFEVDQFKERHHRMKRFIYNITGTTIAYCSTNCTASEPTLPGIATAVLSGLGLLFALNPPPGLVPSDQPQPGSKGGGDSPNNNPGNVLDLVPFGLTAVATFPPFEPSSRTFPAVAVIWREPAGTVAETPLRKKRGLRRRQRPFRRSWNPFRRSRLASRIADTSNSMLDTFLKKVRCVGPRLTAQFGRKPTNGKKKRDTGYGAPVKEVCGTVDDCFDNYQPCPRYGFAIRYTFTKGGQSYKPTYGISERQTGEGFRSVAPPDCRITG